MTSPTITAIEKIEASKDLCPEARALLKMAKQAQITRRLPGAEELQNLTKTKNDRHRKRMEKKGKIMSERMNHIPAPTVTLNNDGLPISSAINEILIKYSSLLAEVERLNKPDGWRPIAEAPRDWSNVILFLPENGNQVIQGYYDADDECWRSMSSMNTDHNEAVKPTHFQPLPEPPKE